MSDNPESSQSLPAAAGNSGPDTPSGAAQGSDAATPPPAGPHRYAFALALIAILIGVGALVGGYFIWHEVNRQASWQQEVLAQIDSRNQSMDERIRTAVDRLDAGLAAAERARQALRQDQDTQSRSIEGLERSLSVLRAQLGRSQEAWVLAEAEYLLTVANQRLQLARDRGAALAALRSADQRLQELGNPAYLPVRDRISQEISALQAVPEPDIPGIALQLQTLSEQVEDFELAGAEYRPPEAEPGDSGEAELGEQDWKDLPGIAWSELRKLVVVRRNDEPVTPMLAPDQRFFLYANLRLQLDTARLALLRAQPTPYRSSLEQARTWLRQEFDTETPAVREALGALEELAGIPIRPELPDISGSLNRLRREMQLQAVEAEGKAATGDSGAQPGESAPPADAPAEPGS